MKPAFCRIVADLPDHCSAHPLRDGYLVILGDAKRHFDEVKGGVDMDNLPAGEKRLQFEPCNSGGLSVQAGAEYFIIFCHAKVVTKKAG